MTENMAHSEYGLWFLVILNSAIFIIFAFSFAKPFQLVRHCSVYRNVRVPAFNLFPVALA